jgi:hypothetical protein
MITPRARDGFERLVRESLVATLSRDGGAEVLPVEQLGEVQGTHVVVLSVASYRFRLLMGLYFSRDASTRERLARLHGLEPEAMTEQAFDDAIAECGNLFCGTFNRELGRAFPHVGMSTPNVLRRSAIEHLGLLRCGHVRHLLLTNHGQPAWYATLAVCEQGTLDFELPPAQACEADAAGELEFF